MGQRERPLSLPEEGPIPIGMVIRALRRRTGKRVGEFAVEIGYDDAHVSHVETGKLPASDEFLQVAARVFGLQSVDDMKMMSREQIAELLKSENDPSRSIKYKLSPADQESAKILLQNKIRQLNTRIIQEEQTLERLRADRAKLQKQIEHLA